MKPIRVALWPCALVLLAAGAAPVQAAWCNVFQVCCSSCGGGAPPVTSSYYAPSAACCNPCPQVCTTQYRARCYYEPVTSYTTKTYYQPVTTYRTSYYYEPVTSYRTSSYYDPCTCSYKQVCTPCTSYQLRSQCCPVQSWVARCMTVPVTTYRQAVYYEPVTSCANPCPDPCQQSAPVTGGGYAPTTPAGPSGTPNVQDYTNPSDGIRYDPKGGTDGTSYRQVLPRGSQYQPTQRPFPNVHLDRVVSLESKEIKKAVRGKIVDGRSQPHGNRQLLFIRTDKRGEEKEARSDSAGRFEVSLTPGSWRIYVRGADGKLGYHSKLEVGEQSRSFTLVSR